MHLLFFYRIIYGIYDYMDLNTQNDRNDKRTTIGILLGRLDESLQREVCAGIEDFVKERDLNVIYYAGRPLNYFDRFETLCNIIFDLINPEIVDGLISITGALCSHTSYDKCKKYLQKYKNSPLVSITVDLEDFPCILIDNRTGIYNAVNHLIKDHGCRRITFIKGPDKHYEADLRFSA